MGLSLGSNVISTNNEYGYKANVLQELEQAQNARIQALQAASDAQASALNSSQNATICTNAMENAQTYMIAAQSFMTSANESATNAYNYAHSVDPDNIVHIDGDETITGIKTFTSNANVIQPIKIKNSKMDSSLSTIPSEPTYSRYLFTDINNKDIGNYSLLQDADGNISTYMQAINYQSGSRDAATINLYNRADGTKYATCPPPPNAADNSTKIPTTAWVNARINAILNSYDFVKESGGDDNKWYRLWSDGWLEQGGTSTNKTNTQVMTFLKTFKNIPNVQTTIVSTREKASYDGEIFPRAITTSNFTFGSRLNDITRWSWYACGF